MNHKNKLCSTVLISALPAMNDALADEFRRLLTTELPLMPADVRHQLETEFAGSQHVLAFAFARHLARHASTEQARALMATVARLPGVVAERFREYIDPAPAGSDRPAGRVECVACLDMMPCVMTLPCRHVALCMGCSAPGNLEHCPLCRTPVIDRCNIKLP